MQEIIRDFDLRPWAPPTLDGTLFFPGYDGGAEWGGSAFDPATNRLVVNMSEIGGILQLYEIPVGFSDGGVYAEHCGSCHGPDLEGTTNGPGLEGVMDRLGRTAVETIVREGRDRMPAFGHLEEIERRGVMRHLAAPAASRAAEAPSTEVRYAHGGYRWVRDHDGLPGNTPPWGTLTSVDLATGEFDWQVPFGGYPGHEDLGYGSESYGGPVVTAGGLVFIAATPDRRLRAIDVRNGGRAVAGGAAGGGLLHAGDLYRRRAAVRGHRGRGRPTRTAVRIGVLGVQPAGTVMHGCPDRSTGRSACRNHDAAAVRIGVPGVSLPEP